MRSVLASGLLLVLAATPVRGLNVSTHLYEPTDFARYLTFELRDGTPAKDGEIGEEIRDLVERHLLARGLTRDDAHPDAIVLIHAQQVGTSVLGMLYLDLLDGRSEKLVWRAEGSVTLALGKPRKIRRQIEQLIKEIFKRFPISGR